MSEMKKLEALLNEAEATRDLEDMNKALASEQLDEVTPEVENSDVIDSEKVGEDVKEVIVENGIIVAVPEGFDILSEGKSEVVKQGLMANGWSMSQRGRYDEELMTAQALGVVKSTLGLTIATCLSAISLVGLPVAYATAIANSVRKNNNLERINSESYQELIATVKADPKCQEILKKIKKELCEVKPDKKDLKALKADFFAAVRNAKENYKESLEEFIISFDRDNMLTEEDTEVDVIETTPDVEREDVVEKEVEAEDVKEVMVEELSLKEVYSIYSALLESEDTVLETLTEDEVEIINTLLSEEVAEIFSEFDETEALDESFWGGVNKAVDKIGKGFEKLGAGTVRRAKLLHAKLTTGSSLAKDSPKYSDRKEALKRKYLEIDSDPKYKDKEAAKAEAKRISDREAKVARSLEYSKRKQKINSSYGFARSENVPEKVKNKYFDEAEANRAEKEANDKVKEKAAQKEAEESRKAIQDEVKEKKAEAKAEADKNVKPEVEKKAEPAQTKVVKAEIKDPETNITVIGKGKQNKSEEKPVEKTQTNESVVIDEEVAEITPEVENVDVIDSEKVGEDIQEPSVDKEDVVGEEETAEEVKEVVVESEEVSPEVKNEDVIDYEEIGEEISEPEVDREDVVEKEIEAEEVKEVVVESEEVKDETAEEVAPEVDREDVVGDEQEAEEVKEVIVEDNLEVEPAAVDAVADVDDKDEVNVEDLEAEEVAEIVKDKDDISTEVPSEINSIVESINSIFDALSKTLNEEKEVEKEDEEIKEDDKKEEVEEEIVEEKKDDEDKEEKSEEAEEESDEKEDEEEAKEEEEEEKDSEEKDEEETEELKEELDLGAEAATPEKADETAEETTPDVEREDVVEKEVEAEEVKEVVVESEEVEEPADKQFCVDTEIATPEVADNGTEEFEDHKEEVVSEEAHYSSLKEACMLEAEYFETDSINRVTACDKKEKLLTQIAMLIAKDSKDPMFDALVEHSVKAKQFKVEILDKYRVIAEEKVQLILNSLEKRD